MKQVHRVREDGNHNHININEQSPEIKELYEEIEKDRKRSEKLPKDFSIVISPRMEFFGKL